MKSYLEILNEIKRENQKYFDNYLKYAKIAKKGAKKKNWEKLKFLFLAQ